VAASEELGLNIYIPPIVYTAYKSCTKVNVYKMLTCIGKVMYQYAGAVTFNRQLNELVIFSKASEDTVRQALSDCCKKKCGCDVLEPAYRFETAREIVWEFVSFRIMFRKG